MASGRWTVLSALIAFVHALTAQELKPIIHIEGVKEELRRNIQAHLSLLNEDCTSPNWRLKDAMTSSESEIRQALRALGYYRPSIRSKFQFTPPCWQAEFTIEPGVRVMLAQVDVQVLGEAANDPKFQALLAHLPLKSGDPIDHGRYEDLKSRLTNLAEQRGFFDARLIKHELIVDPSQNLAWIRLHLDSGRRYTIGKIDLLQEVLNPEFVRRYFPFKPGDPYTSTQLTKTYQILADSGYFEDVEVRALRDQLADFQIPIRIRLLARKRHFFKAGAGFDTNTGPRVLLGYENRRLNPYGHRLDLQARFSPVRSELNGQYVLPWRNPAEETLSFQTGYLHEETDTLRTDSAALGARFLHLRRTIQETLGLDLRYESSRFHDADVQGVFLLIPSVQWGYVKADDRLRPKRGFKSDISLKGGVSLLGNPVRFFQAQGYVKGVYQFPWLGRVLSRLEAGATFTDHFANLPASFRFLAGGDTSLRGYGYKRLGPKNRKGEVVGGRYLGVASLEYEQLFLRNWGASLFVDAGNAFMTWDEPIQVGAGLGIRWYSPVGPLRLDLAVPVTKASFEPRVHVSMGAEL